LQWSSSGSSNSSSSGSSSGSKQKQELFKNVFSLNFNGGPITNLIYDFNNATIGLIKLKNPFIK